jgi:N-acetylglucosamine kinase
MAEIRVMIFVVGIDGGGSGTTAVLASADGTIVGTAVAGPANFQAVGEAAAIEAVSVVLAVLLHAAGIPARDLSAVAAGLAGLHTAQDRERFASLIGALVPSSQVMICTDADIALAAIAGAGPGIAVIAGTGSIAVGRNREGKTGRSGGWGYLIGDEGSAYALGLGGLQAASRGLDGRASPTSLADAFAHALGVDRFDNLLRPLYGPPPLTRRQIAQLAPLVTMCARSGDAAARRLLRRAGQDLADLVMAVATTLQLGDRPFPVGYSGGVWRAGPLLEGPFRRRVLRLRALPLARISPPTLAPAAGAAFLALAGGVSPVSPAEIWEYLQQTCSD